MDRKVEYLWIVIACILNAVSMVNVPVQDQNSVRSSRCKCMFSCDCHIVEIAEAYRRASREMESPKACVEISTIDSPMASARPA
jgi:hypothetical protein